MPNDSSNNTVAVYWDFENLHAALYERDWAGRNYNDPRYRYVQQDALVNVKAIMDFAATIGDIAINRAYNNWQWFARYRDALNSAGIDLIQIYPKGMRGKNGADIRLALDALEDLFRYPKLTHVIIVGSDSDFVSLAQKLKQSGLSVIGVGVHQVTNRYWAQNCDEFKYYDTLLVMKEVAAREEQVKGREEEEEEEEEEPAVRSMSVEDARKLMLDALRRLIAQKGEEQINQGSLKQMMKRMDSTFDEANLGFLSFGAFTSAFPDVIEVIPDEGAGKVRLRSPEAQVVLRSEPSAVAAPAATEQDYEMILRRGNVRMMAAPWWREAVEVVDEIFREAPQQQITSFDDLEGELAARLDAAGLDCDAEKAHKLRGLLFSLFQFQLDKENQTISLRARGAEPLLHAVDREIVRRIVKFVAPPIDVARVAAILYGEYGPQELANVQELVDGFSRDQA